MLYISHKMNEVFTLADRVTVLRDGQFVAVGAARRHVARPGGALDGRPRDRRPELRAAPDPASGRSSRSTDLSLASPPGSGRPSLQRHHVSRSRPARSSGVAGLLGAGRTELLEAIFGASPLPPTGTIALEGRPVRFRHPDEAIQAGIAMVTEDRKTLGLFDRMTVAENITIRRLPELTIGAVR